MPTSGPPITTGPSRRPGARPRPRRCLSARSRSRQCDPRRPVAEVGERVTAPEEPVAAVPQQPEVDTHRPNLTRRLPGRVRSCPMSSGSCGVFEEVPRLARGRRDVLARRQLGRRPGRGDLRATDGDLHDDRNLDDPRAPRGRRRGRGRCRARPPGRVVRLLAPGRTDRPDVLRHVPRRLRAAGPRLAAHARASLDGIIVALRRVTRRCASTRSR